MSRRFLTPVGLHSATSDPSSASIGNMYFNTASNVLRLYFNSKWNNSSTTASVINASEGYYGSFYSASTQTNPVPNIRRAMTFTNTEISNGVTLTTASTFTIANAGVYNIQFSAQFEKTDSGTDEFDVWLYENGEDIPWTNTRITTQGNNTKVVAAWNWLVYAEAGHDYSILWSSPDDGIQLLAQPEQTGPTRPGIPSIILTVQQVTYGVQIASVSYATVSASSTISSSATVASHASTASAIAGNLVSGRVASATFAASVDWGGVTSKPTSIASATISSSAVIANHAKTASSIAGSLVTGTVASATVASHAGTASSINASLITGTTLPAAIVNSSLTSLGTLSNLTVSGSLNVDSGTLFVDATNNEVGILTTSPASALHVVGGALVTRNLSASGTLFSGSAILGGTNGLYLGLGDATYAGTASGAAIQLGTTSGSRTIRLFTPNSSGNNGLRLFISDSNTSVWSDLLISPTFSVRSSQLTASTEIFGVNTSTGLTTASTFSITGNASVGGMLTFKAVGGQEGGEFTMERPPTTSLSANIAIDIFSNFFRIFENAGNARGAFLDLTKQGNNVSSEFWTSGNLIRGEPSPTTSSVAGFFVISVVPGTSLNGCTINPRGTASRIIIPQVNTGINGVSSAGFIRCYVENNAGTALAIGTSVPLYYLAW